jgi:hypothetical protein
MSWQINGGIDIKVQELDSDFEIRTFVLREVVGGKIAEGEFSVSFKHENSRINFLDLTIVISDDTGYSVTINAYAYDIKYEILSMTIKFICAPREFIRENIVKSYDSVLKAINANWTGNFDYKPGTDIVIDVHQRMQTGYQLVANLIKVLRNKAAYGFRCDELFVRDLDDNFDFDLGEQGIAVQTNGINISKSKVKDLEVKSEALDVNSSVTYSKVFRQVMNDYVEPLSNYFINNSLFKILGAYKIPVKYTRFEPAMKIGHLLKYQLQDINFNKWVIFSKTTNWVRGQGVSTTLELMGYDWSEVEGKSGKGDPFKNKESS